MRFIDAHLHTNLMDDGQLQGLAAAGMQAVVIPMLHTIPGMFEADATIRLWDQFLGFEVKRGGTIGYQAFVSLSVPMYGMSPRANEECLKKLEEYATHESVVAIGEIGLDAGIEPEKELLRAQLRIARDNNLPVIMHTPIRLAPHGPEVIREVVRIVEEEGFDISRVVLDHSGESTFDYRMSTGAMVGLSVCMDKLPPEVAARYAADNPDRRDRLIVNTEVASGDGYFTVPMVSLVMKRLGMKHREIEQVLYENPRRFFNLPMED